MEIVIEHLKIAKEYKGMPIIFLKMVKIIKQLKIKTLFF